jgi:hypothetical protein
MSGSATTNAPAMAMAIPIHWRRVGGSRNQPAERSATIAGCVFTSTTDAATVVNPIDEFHVQK